MKIYLFLAVTFSIVYEFSSQPEPINFLQNDNQIPSRVRIAVIGAGVGGLVSIRHLKKEIPSAEIVGFDLNGELGGNWVYSDKVGKDEYGIPIMSSMYKSLRANLPKNLMSFSDFPVPSYYNSFMNRTEFLKYLQNYAKTFDLSKNIMFRHMVTSVKLFDEKWLVTYQNMVNKKEFSEIFDFVIVANGHFSKLAIPQYKGMNSFKGSQIHSHDYKTPDRYANRTVLIIGAGASGLDISIEVAKIGKKVLLSHHDFKGKFKSPFPENHIQKPDVVEFTENSAIFNDGTEEKIDDVVFCTGYGYDVPFLDNSCEIEIERTFITPLYRHIVNANHPSMLFIGIPQLCCSIPMLDTQAKYIAAAVKGNFKLPSKDKMLEEIERDYNAKDKRFYPVPRIATHTLGNEESLYYAELAEEAGIQSTPPVLCAIRYSTMNTRQNMYTFRNYNYRIIDNEHFIRTYGEGTDSEKKEVFGLGKCKTPVKSYTRKNLEAHKEDMKIGFDSKKVQNNFLSFNDININKNHTF